MLAGPTGGGQEASSSWAPSEHVASGDENVPLDIRDEVISPPTTFEEANAEGGIPSAQCPESTRSLRWAWVRVRDLCGGVGSLPQS